MVTLPTQATEPIHAGPSISLFYGFTKVGKSHCMTQLPNHLILDLERGYDHHTAVKLQPANIREILEIFDAIIAAKRPYKFVVIDTVDMVEDFCEVQATLDYKGSTIGKNYDVSQGPVTLHLDKGAGYLWLRRSLNSVLTKARMVAEHVIFVGHVRVKQTTSAGIDVDMFDIDMSGKCAKMLGGICDAIGHLTRRRRKDAKGMYITPPIEDLWVNFKSSDTIVCGARPQHLQGKEFVLCAGDDMKARWDLIFPSGA